MTWNFQAGEASSSLMRLILWTGIASILFSSSLLAQEQPAPNPTKLYPAGTISMAAYTNQPAPYPSITSLQDILNGAYSKSTPTEVTAPSPSNTLSSAIARSFKTSYSEDVASVREILLEGKRKF